MDYIIDIVLVLGIGINALIILVLWNKTQFRFSRNLLIGVFVAMMSIYMNAYASLHSIQILYETSFIFDFSALWIIGPLLVLYVKSVFGDRTKFEKSDLMHFLPFFLVLGFIGIPYALGFYIHVFRFDYLLFLDDHQEGVVFIRGIHAIAYSYFGLSVFNRLRNTSKGYDSISKDSDNWIQILLICCLIFNSMDFLLMCAEIISGGFSFNSGYITVFVMIGFSIYLGYHGIRQSQFLLPDFLEHRKLKLIDKPSSASSHIVIENAEWIKLEFETKIRDKQYYLDEDLTLGKLASYFDTTDKWVSSLLNKYIGVSFYDYINSFRIEEVKRRLLSADYADYKIVAVAYDCGFSSKSSFNRIFKKETGQTPSEFRSAKIHSEKIQSRGLTASIDTF